MLWRKSVLAAKIETTSGTDASPGATDAAMNVYNVTVEPTITVDDVEGQGGFDYINAVPGQYSAKVSFRTNVQWDGTSTEPLWADTFFPACGWVKTVNTYNPVTESPGSNVKTLTFYHYVDGKIRKVTGAAGTFKIVLTAGKAAYIDWDFQGVWQGEPDGSIVSPTYPTDTNLRWASGTCSWNSVSLKASTATIDAGNTITYRQDPTTASGLLAGIITNRRPKITIDPESVLAATQDRLSLWTSRNEYALALWCGGPSASNWKIDAPKAQILSLKYGDREKLVIDQVEFGCNKNGATQDQCLQITFG